MTSRPRQLCAWGLGCMRAHMATHAGGAGRPYPVLDRGRVARARLVPAVKGERARCIHAQRACRALLHRALALRQLGLAARQRGRRGGRRRAARRASAPAAAAPAAPRARRQAASSAASSLRRAAASPASGPARPVPPCGARARGRRCRRGALRRRPPRRQGSCLAASCRILQAASD